MGKIFIVEDDFTRKVELASLLSDAGFEVVSGERGESLMPSIISAKPKVIITDIDANSPEAPLAAIEIMIKSPELKGAEVFIYADEIDVSLEVRLRRLKLSSYFTKEPSPESILAATKGFFDTKVVLGDFSNYMDYPEREPETSSAPKARPRDREENIAPDDPGFGHADGMVSKGISEEDGESLYNIGMNYLEMGLLAEAIHEFARSAKDPKTKVEAVSAAGIALRKIKQYKEAIAKFKEGLDFSQNPEEIKGLRYEVGVTFQEMGKLKEAFNFLGAVYKTDKSYRDATKRLVAIQQTLKIGEAR